MNFVKLNNNVKQKNTTMESHYQDKLRVDTSLPMTVYGNCRVKKVQYAYNFKDESCIVEKFDMKEVNKKNEKMSGKARVVVEKLPDWLVQQHLAKREKNDEKMNSERKLSDSSVEQFVAKGKTDNCTDSIPVNGYFTKKEEFETDNFVKELLNPTMQQYLANTEMGCLTDDFEEISDPLEISAKSNNCTIDSLINNLSGDTDVQYPAQMENTFQDQFIKSLSCQQSTVQPCQDISNPVMQNEIVDVEKLDDVMESPKNVTAQENVFKKKNISKRKSRNNRRRCRTNITTKLYQRICPVCYKYVEKPHKTNDKVKCDTCKTLTFFECNACKKLTNTYSGIADHLLYRCEARNFYKCAHCKYSVTKKQTLSCHIRRNHEKQILRHLLAKKNNRVTEEIGSKLQQNPEHDRRFENLIVLKKQKEMKSKSEWIIENVKRSDLKVNKSVELSVPPTIISNQPIQNVTSSTSVENACQLYCEHCEKELEIDAYKTETYCRTCGTDYRFMCSKCQSTFESYPMMKLHLKRCTSKNNSRGYIHCSECNYRSIFQGLVVNHQHQIHGIEQLQQFSTENSILNYSQSD